MKAIQVVAEAVNDIKLDFLDKLVKGADPRDVFNNYQLALKTAILLSQNKKYKEIAQDIEISHHTIYKFKKELDLAKKRGFKTLKAYYDAGRPERKSLVYKGKKFKVGK